jgi:hypothetical protein
MNEKLQSGRPSKGGRFCAGCVGLTTAALEK